MVIVILALGIAINTVIFTVADASLFRGLPYPNGARIVELVEADEAGVAGFAPGLSPQRVDEWRRHDGLFDAIEGWDYATFHAGGSAEPEEVAGAFVTPGLFAAIGVTPARGRMFVADDTADGRAVIISDRLWRRRFAADPRSPASR